ncbi:hypothetical protein BaRGS_00030085 [Batillaria attramentaria]
MTTSLRHSPTAIYMVTLAALDWVISLYAGLHLLPMIFVGEERFFTESWHCRAYYFIFLFVVHFDTLTLVSMTAQRYVAVNFPLHASRWSSRRGSALTLGVAAAIAFLANFVHLVTFELQTDFDGRYRGRCNVGSGIGQYVQMRVYPWIDSVLYFFFPTVTISVLNVLIFLALKKADNFKRQAGVTGPEHGANSGWQGDRFSASKTDASDNAPSVDIDIYPDVVPGSELATRVSSSLSTDNNNGTVHHISTEASTRNTAVTVNPNGIAGQRDVTKSTSSTQLTRMLLTVSVAFLVLTLPMGVFVVLFRYWNPHSGYEKALFSLVRDIADNLMFTNHAINFLLYCLSGARFRSKAASIIHRTCRARGVGGARSSAAWSADAKTESSSYFSKSQQ